MAEKTFKISKAELSAARKVKGLAALSASPSDKVELLHEESYKIENKVYKRYMATLTSGGTSQRVRIGLSQLVNMPGFDSLCADGSVEEAEIVKLRFTIADVADKETSRGGLVYPVFAYSKFEEISDLAKAEKREISSKEWGNIFESDRDESYAPVQVYSITAD